MAYYTVSVGITRLYMCIYVCVYIYVSVCVYVCVCVCIYISASSFFKDLFISCVYTVAVFRLTRKGCRIPLQMVVSYHMVAGNSTQDLWKSSQCSNR